MTNPPAAHALIAAALSGNLQRLWPGLEAARELADEWPECVTARWAPAYR